MKKVPFPYLVLGPLIFRQCPDALLSVRFRKMAMEEEVFGLRVLWVPRVSSIRNDEYIIIKNYTTYDNFSAKTEVMEDVYHSRTIESRLVALWNILQARANFFCCSRTDARLYSSSPAYRRL